MKYDCVYQDLQDEKWVPLKDPVEPVVQFAAFGKPLNKDQLEALAASQEMPPPKMGKIEKRSKTLEIDAT